MTSVEVWERLMARTIQAHLEADYSPGGNFAPGGQTDPDPMGIHYVNLGPLAYMLNEALNGLVSRGADRDDVLNDVADATGADNEQSAHDAEAVLNGDELCPATELLSAFAQVLSLSADTLIDAAKRGGCTNYGGSSLPPGY